MTPTRPTRRKKKRQGRPRRYLFDDENGRRVLVCFDGLTLYATQDRHDGAHLTRDARQIFLSAAQKQSRSRPRLYPLSSMTVCRFSYRAVAWDSAWDVWAERVAALARDGVYLIPRARPQSETVAEVAAKVRGDVRLRDVLHSRTKSARTARERELEREGTRLLREAEAKR